MDSNRKEDNRLMRTLVAAMVGILFALGLTRFCIAQRQEPQAA